MRISCRYSALFVGIALLSRPAFAPPDYSPLLTELTNKSNQWLQIEQRIVEAQNRRRIEKESLEHSLFILESIKEELETTIATQSASNTQLQKDYRDSLSQLKSQQEGVRALSSSLNELEGKMIALSNLFPPPLRDKTRTQLNRLKEIGDDDALRIQTLLTILIAAEKFDNSLNLSNSIRELDNGERCEVRELYWGLAFGYAISVDGSNAWILSPSQERWTWSPANEHAKTIRRALDLFEKPSTPTLMTGPIPPLTE